MRCRRADLKEDGLQILALEQHVAAERRPSRAIRSRGVCWRLS
jgi:hypothetical protein